MISPRIIRRVAIVGSNGLVNRLPEVLAHDGLQIYAFAEAGSPILSSAFVDVATRIPIPKHAFETNHIANLALALAAEELDWVIYSDDLVASFIAQSDLPLAAKLKILPVRLESGLPIIGSKAGLAQTMAAFGVPGPRSLVASESEALAAGVADISFPLLLKADVGGGGTTVRVFHDSESFDTFQCPENWFPVVIQEFIPGEMVNVCAFFTAGQLSAWTYGQHLVADKNFGPGTARTYRDPFAFDFEETLTILGKATGMHGFFNCNFIWSEAASRHFLFEADTRPNAWHQFGPKVGVEWATAILGQSDATPLRPSIGVGGHVVIRLFPREIRTGLRNADISMLWPWMRRAEGTWAMRNRADRAINRSETMELVFWFDVYVKRFLTWTTLPRRIIRFLFGFH